MRSAILGRTGLRVSKLGFGAATLGNEYGPADPAEAARAVHAAIDLGIDYFDVAPYYGRTVAEERLGAALAGRRHEVVLATKCGRYDFAHFDFTAARLRASIDESLARLRTDHVDVFLAHDIEFADERQIVEEAIPAMREIQRAGKARCIGITGMQLGILRRVAEAAPVDVILSYCRYNLMIGDMDAAVTPFAREHGIGLINASPFHMGILSEEGPQPWHPAPEDIKQTGRRVVALCRERGVSMADIALPFCLAHPHVSTTLCGMSTVDQVKRNAAAAERPLDLELLGEIRREIGDTANRSWPTGRAENRD